MYPLNVIPYRKGFAVFGPISTKLSEIVSHA